MRVREGDFVCLLGQSGVQVRTFLRLMAVLSPLRDRFASTGSLSRCSGLPGASAREFFQDYGLFPWMSAGESRWSASPRIETPHAARCARWGV